MGIHSLSFFGRRNIKMKAVALFSLIAVAFAEPEAEAKPYYYGAYGLGYGGLYGHGLGYGYGHSVYYGKREVRPSPRLMLILTFSMVAMLDIMAMLDTPTPPTATSSTTARGRLRLMLRPSLTTMVPMVLDMVVFMAMVLAMAMDTASTTARGRLRPRQ